GDPAAIPHLRKVIVRELDGRLRRRAAEVIRDLEDGRAPAEEVTKLRDELGRLRDVVARLRDQVERIQIEAAQHRREARGGEVKPDAKEEKKKKGKGKGKGKAKGKG